MKKFIYLTIVVMASAGLLVACGGSSSKSQEMINGIVVPPDPGQAGKETLIGIDSNDNGVRDDIERYIAQEYGEDLKKFSDASNHAKEFQKLISLNFEDSSTSNIELTSAYRKHLFCSTDKELATYIQSEKAHLNTSARSKKYSQLLAGHGIGGIECE